MKKIEDNNLGKFKEVSMIREISKITKSWAGKGIDDSCSYWSCIIKANFRFEKSITFKYN